MLKNTFLQQKAEKKEIFLANTFMEMAINLTMYSKISTFRDLIVWQKGIELVKEVYKATRNFPQEELYGLTSQMRRAAVSIPSNIAEGFRKRFDKEQKQFFTIAQGSSAELETQIVIAKQLNYITEPTEQTLIDLLTQISRMLTTMYKQL